jgi:hypothetical protein
MTIDAALWLHRGVSDGPLAGAMERVGSTATAVGNLDCLRAC